MGDESTKKLDKTPKKGDNGPVMTHDSRVGAGGASPSRGIPMLPGAALRALGARCRRIRLVERNMTQQELARRANLGVNTLARFEATGVISTRGLVAIAVALGRGGDLEMAFLPADPTPSIRTLEELDALESRRRASRSAPSSLERRDSGLSL